MRGPVVLTTIVLATVFLVAGVALAASVRCDGGPCRGTNQADQMSGSNRADKMFGRGGHDRMDGNRDNDEMYGGSGADTMNGSYGSDRMFGGPDNETMSGGPAKDRMFGDAGTDRIEGNNGNDYINIAGDGETDSVNCGIGFDTLVLDLQDQGNLTLDEVVARTGCEEAQLQP